MTIHGVAKDYQHGIRVADTALETGDSMNPRRVNVVAVRGI